MSLSKKTKSYRLMLFLLLIVLFIFFMMDLALGSVKIPIDQVAAILFNGSSENLAWQNIILKIRLPRTITAILAGAALSVGGLQMQTLFRNPLAGPSVLGITAGASLGVAAVMLLSGSAATTYAIRALGVGPSWLIIISSTTGALIVLLLILAISYKIRDNVVMLIVGLMMANITIAVVSIWQYFSDPEQIQEYVLWTFGSLGGVTNYQLTVLSVVVIVGILATFLLSKSLNVLLLEKNMLLAWIERKANSPLNNHCYQYFGRGDNRFLRANWFCRYCGASSYKCLKYFGS